MSRRVPIGRLERSDARAIDENCQLHNEMVSSCIVHDTFRELAHSTQFTLIYRTFSRHIQPNWVGIASTPRAIDVCNNKHLCLCSIMMIIRFHIMRRTDLCCGRHVSQYKTISLHFCCPNKKIVCVQTMVLCGCGVLSTETVSDFQTLFPYSQYDQKNISMIGETNTHNKRWLIVSHRPFAQAIVCVRTNGFTVNCVVR